MTQYLAHQIESIVRNKLLGFVLGSNVFVGRMGVLSQTLLSGHFVSFVNDLMLNLFELLIHQLGIFRSDFNVVSRDSIVHGVGRHQRTGRDGMKVGQGVASF